MSWQDLAPHELIEACVTQSSSEAWAEFIRRFHPLITSAAFRVSRRWSAGATSEEIDDVIQEIYLKMCADQGRALTKFRSSEPEAVFGFIKVIATNAAHDYFRVRAAAKRGHERTTALKDTHEPAAESEQIERKLTLDQVDGMLVRHTQGDRGPRDRAIFRLYYRHGMTAQAISELPGIELNPKGVEGVLYRLTRAIRNRMTQAQETGGA